MAIKLGSKVKYVHTGSRGISIGRLEHLHGGVEHLVAFNGAVDKCPDTTWIHESYLATVKGDAAPVEKEEAEETPPETDDSGFGEAEEAEEAEAAAPTLDDVIEACQSHAKRVGGREKTQALLLKVFKVKKPQELKSKQFADVIKALSGKK